MKPKVLLTVGTRPEAIKLAPVVAALRAHGGFEVRVLFTGQHRELLDQMADFFDLRADRDPSRAAGTSGMADAIIEAMG